MNVNATLIVQAGNFFCAYLILRYWLFKPTLAAIKEQEDHEESITMLIEKTRLAVLNKAQERDDLWAACYKHFQKQSPASANMQDAILRNITPDLEPNIIAQDEMDRLIDKGANLIATRLGGRQ
jgi:hypothetical protein